MPGARPGPADLLSLEEAAATLGLGVEQAQVLVEQGLLVPSGGSAGSLRFTSAAVEAVRLAGG